MIFFFLLLLVKNIYHKWMKKGCREKDKMSSKRKKEETEKEIERNRKERERGQTE